MERSLIHNNPSSLFELILGYARVAVVVALTSIAIVSILSIGYAATKNHLTDTRGQIGSNDAKTIPAAESHLPAMWVWEKKAMTFNHMYPTAK